MSIAPATKIGYEGGLAYDKEIVNKMPRAAVADGNGPTTKFEIPKNALLADTVEIGGKEKTNSASKKNFLSTALLLVGGAIIGYCCKGPISKGIETIKNSVGGFFSNGKPAELLDKAKNLIFSK